MTDPELTLVPLEVRSVDEAQRTALMRVVRYGELSRRTPKPERFIAGAFAQSVETRGARVPFTTRHTAGTGTLPRGATVARPVSWQADGDDLLATLRFFDSEDGWRAYWRAKDGELDGGSIGFRAVEERTGADGAREVVVGELHHVMLLAKGEAQPAYDEPGILEVRARDTAALLAVKWDPALAEGVVDPAELARMGRQV